MALSNPSIGALSPTLGSNAFFPSFRLGPNPSTAAPSGLASFPSVASLTSGFGSASSITAIPPGLGSKPLAVAPTPFSSAAGIPPCIGSAPSLSPFSPGLGSNPFMSSLHHGGLGSLPLPSVPWASPPAPAPLVRALPSLPLGTPSIAAITPGLGLQPGQLPSWAQVQAFLGPFSAPAPTALPTPLPLPLPLPTPELSPAKPSATIAEEALQMKKNIDSIRESQAEQFTMMFLSNMRQLILDAAMHYQDSITLDLKGATHATYTNPYTRREVDMDAECLEHVIRALEEEGLGVAEESSGQFRISWMD